jgi:hypothetical protein
VPSKSAGFTVTGCYFSSRAGDALARNQQRTGRARVPERGLLGTYKLLERPNRAEGFDHLFYVSIGTNGAFVVEDWKDET